MHKVSQWGGNTLRRILKSTEEVIPCKFEYHVSRFTGFHVKREGLRDQAVVCLHLSERVVPFKSIDA